MEANGKYSGLGVPAGKDVEYDVASRGPWLLGRTSRESDDPGATEVTRQAFERRCLARERKVREMMREVDGVLTLLCGWHLCSRRLRHGGKRGSWAARARNSSQDK